MKAEQRDRLGRKVREAWVIWAKQQPNPKPSWLLPYDELSEPNKEADRQIGEAVATEQRERDAGKVAHIKVTRDSNLTMSYDSDFVNGWNTSLNLALGAIRDEG